MKTFLKLFFIMTIAFFLVGAGYYLTLNNISLLLAPGKPNWQCQRLGSELLIKTEAWSEVIKLWPAVKITRQTGSWVFCGKNRTLIVNTAPRIRIQWKKSLTGRRSVPNGEYK